MKKINWLFALVVLITLFAFIRPKPALFIIGDSTVRNGSGSAKNVLQGWGSYLGNYFDSSKIYVENDAIGGRSSRSFIGEGRWDSVLNKVQKGDFLLVQFGHNDSGPLDDTARARGSIKGIGEESKDVYNPVLKKKETVHTYGWYLRKYIKDAKAKGVYPIICSPIPRNDWKDGKVLRNNDSYALWAKQVATEEKVPFIDLNNVLADDYQKEGKAYIANFFPEEHTHTNEAGARYNAKVVANQIRLIQSYDLKKYLLP
ncbi:rhamnogalacturonan acetylesterase [Rhizosphaericola mali]|uniref:Rhamnogalacturonan acetylesterase n=1 Tax=Rhizosphaericola mali TaxID=2545455 RepID=A0A5P2G0T5_9BACT|nr:rhamnogalacturonan acetylesterase [Rhizosphaericola mali]QES88797.1 rhamnogalacturonan acetylesterase [Rhizosphaericola mali]